MNLLTIQIKKIYCIKWNKYRKFKKTKISNIFNERLVLSITCNKHGNNYGRIFKKESTEIIDRLIDNTNE